MSSDDTRFFCSAKLLYSKLSDDVKMVYNDTVPPNNYAIKSRLSYRSEPLISAAFGFVIERDIYSNILSLRLHPELVINLPGDRSAYSNATNRVVLNVGICYKVE